MDLESAIIGAIILAVCILPIIIMNRNRKKRDKKILQSLNNIANKQNCIISQHDICGDFVIGIDETHKFVFFFKQLKDKDVEQSINLAEIKNCKVKNTIRKLDIKDSNQNIIDKLELIFIPYDKNKEAITMEFFNTDIDTQLNGELQVLEKWSDLIISNINNKK